MAQSPTMGPAPKEPNSGLSYDAMRAGVTEIKLAGYRCHGLQARSIATTAGMNLLVTVVRRGILPIQIQATRCEPIKRRYLSARLMSTLS